MALNGDPMWAGNLIIHAIVEGSSLSSGIELHNLTFNILLLKTTLLRTVKNIFEFLP